MIKLIEAFAQAIKDGNMTKTEIAWSLMVTDEQLEEILTGKREMNNPQELEVYRFIFKTNNKKKLQANG